MEELNATVRQNADNARQASELAKSSNELALRAGGQVQSVVATMEAIEQSSRKISDIIGVIDSIAFQTNILALNAAVEAARAGEQGGLRRRGEQVRSLAQRWCRCCQGDKGLIGESVATVQNGAGVVRQAGDTVGEVVSSFQQVSALVQEISSASREQASGIDQVTLAVSQMDESRSRTRRWSRRRLRPRKAWRNRRRGWCPPSACSAFPPTAAGGRWRRVANAANGVRRRRPLRGYGQAAGSA